MTQALTCAFLLIVSMLTRCGGSSLPTAAEALTPISGARTLETEDYLDHAVAPGSLFRWTPSVGRSEIDVPIEIFDGDGELPARFLADGMHPAEIERQVWDVVQMWAQQASLAGLTVRPEFAYHSKGQSFDGDGRARINLHFRSPPTGDFGGLATLQVWSTAPDVILSAELTITVPNTQLPIQLSGYQALLAHEFGHAFGLISAGAATGHSPDGNDVMYPLAQWSSLSDGDRLAIQELYRRTPDLIRSGAIQPTAPGPQATKTEAFRHSCTTH
ncbi:MAG: matrixin family metalloprotease [Planctomycetota bacterium]